MGTVYSGVDGIEVPHYSRENYQKDCDTYIKDIQGFAKKFGKGKYKGKLINFPVADGYASYVILSLKPVKLIHINVMDGYHFQYVHRLTAKDIIEEFEYKERLAKAFEKKSQNDLSIKGMERNFI